MALAPISRATTVTVANPTPPTNVPVVYQGTPPTQAGLAAAGAAAPDVTDANIYKFADPVNGATAPQLSGLAEGDGTEAVVYFPAGSTSANDFQSARATDGNYSETPNASHPSFNTRAKMSLLEES